MAAQVSECNRIHTADKNPQIYKTYETIYWAWLC